VAARKAVAKALQTTPAAIKQAERRAAIATECCDEPAKHVEATIETWGVPLADDVLTAAKFAAGLHRQAGREAAAGGDRADRGPGAACPRPRPSGWSCSGCACWCATSRRRLRSKRPAAICPICKRVPRLLAGCAMCGGTGLASDEEVKRAPKETTRKGGKAGVFVGPGDFRAIDEVGDRASSCGPTSARRATASTTRWPACARRCW
jgi:hypothetical protein